MRTLPVFLFIVLILTHILSCNDQQNNLEPPLKYHTAATNGNHLLKETSPYLLSHAHNPVDWYGWGQEALKRAKQLNRPIFLSIGYSACHWCHVMEKESFEDLDVAKYLNDHFVSIKVDREERPDLDRIYMRAVQLMTGRGGWPMTVFLTPDLKPFFGGTYFPKNDWKGKAGFLSIIKDLSESWKTQESKVIKEANRMGELISQSSITRGDITYLPSISSVNSVLSAVTRKFDNKDGGFGKAPKFPHTLFLELLLRRLKVKNHTIIREMVNKTLTSMANGGIYDHIGGGFHRYSTDVKWLVPHFEKMLYDNALLSSLYSDAWLLTSNDLYLRRAKSTLDYVIREMTTKFGAFASTQDADSEGEEGKFYIWDSSEIEELLGVKDFSIFKKLYSINVWGNFNSREEYHKRKNILHLTKYLGAQEQRFANSALGLLKKARDKRVKPLKDDKIITAWNGLMISALAKGYQVFGHKKYLDSARGAARFIISKMLKSGTLYRIHRKGKTKIPGFVNDYFFFANSLINLYESDFNREWLIKAEEITKIAMGKLWDKSTGGFFFSEINTNLITRSKKYDEGAIPSGNGVASRVLFRLSYHLNKPQMRTDAMAITKSAATLLKRNPTYSLTLLLSLTDFYFELPRIIVVSGSKSSQITKSYLDVIHSVYIPGRIIVHRDKSSLPMVANLKIPKGTNGVYVCWKGKCSNRLSSRIEIIKNLENRP
jgi:uncharacterized protein